MRIISVCVLLFFALVAKPQSKLAGAEVQMTYAPEIKKFKVKEKLYVTDILRDQSFTLKALLLDDNFQNNSEISVASSGKTTVNQTEKSDAFNLAKVTFNKDLEKGWIELSYTVKVNKDLTEVPLFFTELSAVSSEEDFFTFELELPENQSVYFHFPTTEVIQTPLVSEKQSISFNLPALPSMIRLELDESQASNKIAVIDISVGLIFLLIGLLIVRYRNVFRYG